MVRYLKVKKADEEKYLSLMTESVISSPSRNQIISEKLKDIPAVEPVQDENIKLNIHPLSASQNQDGPLSSQSLEKLYSKDLMKKVHELESKLKDYEEFVRKKETSEKLALKLKEEENKEQAQQRFRGLFRNVDAVVKEGLRTFRKYISVRHLLVMGLSISLVMILTFIFLLLPKSNYELTIIYRLIQNHKNPDDHMAKRLSAYLTSTPMLTKIIEEIEIFHPKKISRQRELENKLNEYRSRIRVYPDPAQNTVKLTAMWDDPHKAATIIQKMTEAYTELINKQKSVEDYAIYLRKAIEKQSSFKMRNKVLVVNSTDKKMIDDLVVQKGADLKLQLVNLETEYDKLNKIISTIEEKYLSPSPKSVEDFILLGLKSRMTELEIATLLAEVSENKIMLNQSFSTDLLQIRYRMENIIKSRFTRELIPNEKQEIALVLRKATTESKKLALMIILSGQYGLQENFSISQKEYLVNQKNIQKLLENYADYIKSKESLSQNLEIGSTDHIYSNVKSPTRNIYQWQPLYAFSLGGGIFLGLMIILLRKLYS